VNTSHLLAAALSGALSLCAHASVTGLRWVEVDNAVVDPSSDPIAGAAWLANPAGWRTFDLMVVGDPDTAVTGWDMGQPQAQGPPLLLYTDGDIFNHPAGFDLFNPPGPIFDFATLLRFDTAATVNGLDRTVLAFNPATTDFTDGLAGLGGGALGAGSDQLIGDDGELLLLRLTVSADFTFLGNANAPDGLVSALDIFVEDPAGTGAQTITLLYPDVIPSASTSWVALLAMSALSSRRRTS
jgi:hypothetical protein